MCLLTLIQFNLAPNEAKILTLSVEIKNYAVKISLYVQKYSFNAITVTELGESSVTLLIYYTPEVRSLRLHTLARFTDWPRVVLCFALHNFTFFCSLNSLFLQKTMQR